MVKNEKNIKALEKKRRLELALRKNLKRRKIFSQEHSSKLSKKSITSFRENN